MWRLLEGGEEGIGVVDGDGQRLAWGDEHTTQRTDEVLQNRAPDTCIILLTGVTPVNSIKSKTKLTQVHESTWSTFVAITKYHILCGLNNRNLICHSLRGWKRSGFQRGWVLVKMLFLCAHMAFP